MAPSQSRHPFPTPPHLPNQPINWPPQFRLSILQAFSHSWAPSTVRNYMTGISRYLSFCRRHNIHNDLIFPAHEFLLCAFVADLIAQFSPSTIRNILSGLRAWHLSYNTHFPTSDSLMTLARTRIGPPPKQTTRLPVTTHMLRLLATNLSLLDPFDVAVLSCALTCFWGVCRLGELVPPSQAYPPSKFPTLADLSFDPQSNATLTLPWSKTTRWTQSETFLSPQHEPINPIAALQFHCKFNKLLATSPLFSYYSASSHSLNRLTKPAFLQRCNTIWATNNIPFTTGHSFRIGGASHLLASGVDPDIVKIIGRWNSDSFLRYWRNKSLIVPHHVRFLPLGASRGPPPAAARAFSAGSASGRLRQLPAPDGPPRS